MVWLLYNSVLTLLAPLWLPAVWLKSRRREEQPNWKQRLGMLTLPSDGKRRIWVHTVSVGEFVASKPILKEIRRALPDHAIVVTVTTSSGHRTAREAEPGLFDHLLYFPLDLAFCQRSALRAIRPDVVAIMETGALDELVVGVEADGLTHDVD